MSEPNSDDLRTELAYPVFNPAFVPVQIDPNTVNIRIGPWTGPVYTLRDADERGQLTTFVEQIDGETHVDDLIEIVPEDHREHVASLLSELHENDVIYDQSARDDETLSHLSLQRRFGNRERTALRTKQLLLVDCGRMAAQISNDLLDSGVEEIGVVQPLESDSNSLPDREGITHVESRELSAAIAAADFVIYAADHPHPEIVSLVNEIAQEESVPWTSVQIHGLDGFVGPTIFPGETACYACFKERTMANVSKHTGYEHYLKAGDAHRNQANARTPGFGRMLAGYLVMDLVNVLAFGTGYTAGRVIRVDGLRLSVECNDVLKLPRCEICGRQPGEGLSQYITVKDIKDASEWIDQGGL